MSCIIHLDPDCALNAASCRFYASLLGEENFTRQKSTTISVSPLKENDVGNEQNESFIDMMSPKVVLQKLSPKSYHAYEEVLSQHQSSNSSGEVYKPKQSDGKTKDWYLYKRSQREILRIKQLEDQLNSAISGLSQTEHLDTVLLKHKLLQIDTIRLV